MTQTLQNDLTTWCKANVSLDTADRLDRGESPVRLYRALAAKGWLGYANIGKDPDNLYRLAEVCKIINSYSGTLGNMISVNAACAMMLGKFGGAVMGPRLCPGLSRGALDARGPARALGRRYQ